MFDNDYKNKQEQEKSDIICPYERMSVYDAKTGKRKILTIKRNGNNTSVFMTETW